MSDYVWKTEMRRLDDHEARAVDFLGGQAAATVHSDRRITFYCMPDAYRVPAAATISAEDADRLVRVIWAERLAAIERYQGTEATKIKAILNSTDGPKPLKSSHSCRVCGRWLEGDWNRSDDDAQRAEIQRQMDAGRCDTCTAKEATTP